MNKEVIVSVTKKNNKYIVETTSNKYHFTEETVMKYMLFKGKEINPGELEAILKDEKTNSLLNKAINYLSYQARSEEEIIKYLEEKEANPSQIQDIIQKLEALGYVNDEVLCKSILDYVIRNHKGPKLLEQKLMQKGINEDLIKSTLTMYKEETEAEIIDKIIASLKNKYREYPTKKVRNQIYQKLLRDGFSNDLINEKISHTEFIDESDEMLAKDLRKLMIKYQDNLDYQKKNLIISKLIAKGYEYGKILECLNNIE